MRDSLLRNSGYNMGATVATALLGYLYWIVAARAYTPDDVGTAAALVSALTLAALLANLGAGSALVETLPRRAAGEEWSRALTAALLLSLSSGLVVGAVAVAALPLLSARLAIVRADPACAALFVAGVALWSVSTTLDGLFVAERAAGNLFARNTLFAALKIPLLLMPLPVLLGGPRAPGVGILASWVLSTAVACVAGAALLARLGRGYRPALRGVAREARGMARSFAGQHLVNLGGSLPMYLLPLLVTVRLSAAADAYFYTTWKVGSLFFMVSPAVAASLFAEGAHRPEGLGGQARRAALAIGALVGPAMLVVPLAAPAILRLFGPDYPRHGLPLLILLLLSAIPDAVTNIYVSVLRVRGKLRLAAGLNVGMAAATLVLAWIALPSMGIAGAGAAWLAAQVVGGIVAGAHVVTMRRRRIARTRELSATGVSTGTAAVPAADRRGTLVRTHRPTCQRTRPQGLRRSQWMPRTNGNNSLARGSLGMAGPGSVGVPPIPLSGRRMSGPGGDVSAPRGWSRRACDRRGGRDARAPSMRRVTPRLPRANNNSRTLG